MGKKGWIALDIDGTITLDKHIIPAPVITFLKQLYESGWNIVFATGRSYTFASIPLGSLDFPFYFLPQNGSVILKMPEKVIFEKKYLSLEDLQIATRVCSGLHTDPLVYGGFEIGDHCFYRPGYFSLEDQGYLTELKNREGEIWDQVPSFDLCTVDYFPLLKYFGRPEKMKQVAHLLENVFSVAQIRDPFAPGIDLLLVTKKDVSKGRSLERLFNKEGRGSLVIAAGDDINDLSMFEVADFRIAMPHAPKVLLEQADLIATPTSEFGIIQALSKAISS
jgi:hypothetical protein